MILIKLRRPATAFLQSHCIRQLASVSHVMSAEDAEVTEWERARPFEEMPGPKPLPIIGNSHRFLPGIGDMASRDLLVQHTNIMEKYGKIVKITNIPGWRDMVMLFDPKYFEEMYRKEGIWPERDFLRSLTYYRKAFRKDFHDGVGGLLTENGEGWKNFRSKVNPPMMMQRLTQMYLRPILDVSNEFIERTKFLRDSKGETPDDYANELFKWALESITVVALDKRLGCLEPNLKPDSEPQRMINSVKTLFSCWEKLDLRPSLWRIISTPTWRRYVKALDYFTEVSMKHVNEAIERMQQRPPESEYEPSVLELLLQRDSNPKTACVMALDMLIAGIDTTSYSVASLMYHLSRNQEKQQYLFEELKKFMPNRNDNFKFEDLEDMKYLKACMKESMRISGAITCTIRGTQKDTVIGNYRIPKNVNVYMLHLITGRMEENFPQASRFIPERWLKTRPGTNSNSFGSIEDYDTTNAFKTSPFVFLPFGFGPRMCIGRRYSTLELSVLSAKMIRNFLVEYDYGDMEFSSKLVHKPTSPLKFKLTDRKV